MGWARGFVPGVIVAAVIAVAGLLAGCTNRPPAPAEISGWRELPPPIAGARVLTMVRVHDVLLALGSVPGPDGRAPGAWTTVDGRTWHPVALRGSSPYASQAELIHAGVAGDRITVLGQAFGGAHSNPRLTTWSGSVTELVEHPQPVEMFGGPHAIAVNALAARPGSALLVGQWEAASGRYGAAAWTSDDGVAWNLDADDPALASAPTEQTSAVGVAATPTGYLVAGDTVRGTRILPLAWTSTDGLAWRRLAVPDATGSGALAGGTAERAACADRACVLLGATAGSTSTVQCWPVSGDTIGAARPGPVLPNGHVSETVVRGDHVVAAVRTSGSVALAETGLGCGNWTRLPTPVDSRDAALGDLPGGLLLATTGPAISQLWLHAD